MMPFAAGGTALWALAGLILLIFFRDRLAESGQTMWLWICLAGFVGGLIGMLVMHLRARRRRRRDTPSAAASQTQRVSDTSSTSASS